MLETTGGKIATLVIMLAVLAYTTINYINGTGEILLVGFSLFLFLTTGLRIIASLIDDFKKNK